MFVAVRFIRILLQRVKDLQADLFFFLLYADSRKCQNNDVFWCIDREEQGVLGACEHEK